MELRLNQLAANLERALAPIYVVHGDEPLLAIEAGDAIRAAARARRLRRARSPRRRARIQMGRVSRRQRQSRPLRRAQARRPAHSVRQARRRGREGARSVRRASRIPTNMLLVTLPKLDRATQSSAWFTALGGRGRRGRRLSARARRAAGVDRGAPRAAGAARRAGDARVSRRPLRGQPARRAAGDREARPAAARGRARARGRRARGDRRRALRRLPAVRSVARRPTPRARCGSSRRSRPKARACRCCSGSSAEDVHALAAVLEAARPGTPVAAALRNARVWGKRQAAMERAARRIAPEAVARSFPRSRGSTRWRRASAAATSGTRSGWRRWRSPASPCSRVGPHHDESPHIDCSTASAAAAAVSVRSTRGPSRTDEVRACGRAQLARVESAFGTDQQRERRRRLRERGERVLASGAKTMPLPAHAREPFGHGLRRRDLRHAIAAALLAGGDRDTAASARAAGRRARPAAAARCARSRAAGSTSRRAPSPCGSHSPSRRSPRSPCASVTASGDSRSIGRKRLDPHRRAALVGADERRRILAAGAVEERQRIAGGKPQDARRVVRRGFGQRDGRADLGAGDQRRERRSGASPSAVRLPARRSRSASRRSRRESRCGRRSHSTSGWRRRSSGTASRLPRARSSRDIAATSEVA